MVKSFSTVDLAGMYEIVEKYSTENNYYPIK
jgi:hypothetical protein